MEPYKRSPSAASSLRYQMDELKGRINNLKAKAHEDSKDGSQVAQHIAVFGVAENRKVKICSRQLGPSRHLHSPLRGSMIP